MFLIARFLPIVNALAAALVLEVALRLPSQYVDLVNLGAIVVMVGTIVLLHRATNAERLTLLGLALTFFLGTAFLLFFLSAGWLRHTVVIIAATALWLFFEEAYRYIYEPERYHRHALDHLGAFLGVAALAMTVAGLSGLRIFLTVRLVVLLPITFALATIITAAVLATHPMRVRELVNASLIFGLLVTEVAWAVYFLPSHYWVNALLVAIPFYVALHLVRHELGGTLTRRHIRRYSFVALTALVFVISTAQWVL